MADSRRVRASLSVVFSTGILLAGAQDVSTESDLDFTRESNRARVQYPASKARSQFPFVVLDLETTGFSTSYDAIIEIGLLVVHKSDEQLEVQDYEFLVKPPYNIPRKIRELTGITNEMVANADTIDQVIPKVMEVIGLLPIVAYNATFDRRFLEAKSNLIGLTLSANEWICALQMAKRAWPGLENHKLESFKDSLGTEGESHRAVADCQVTLDVYLNAYEDLQGDFPLKPLEPPEFQVETDEGEPPQYDSDLSHHIYVFSGFRDEVLAARIVNSGGLVKSGISKKVTHLLVQSKAEITTKVKKANEYGIEVLEKQEFEASFYV